MSRSKMPPIEDLETLKAWSRPDLVRLWEDTFQSKPPYGSSQALLARLIAYDIQVATAGGGPGKLRRRLNTIASGKAPSAQSPKLKSGARLVREWNGVSHVVDIRDDGTYYRDKRYRSLSAVAKVITGAHWSGPRFFGLTSRERSR